VLFSLLAGACGGAPAGELSELPWSWVEEQRLAPDDTAAGAFFSPTHSVRTHSGHLVVADANPRSIKVFDAAGAFVGTIGREGSGPGEYRYIQLGVDLDTVVVFDPIQRRVMRFALDGTLLRSTEAESNYFGPAMDVAADGSALLRISDAVLRIRRDGTIVDRRPRPPEWSGPRSAWEFQVPSERPGEVRRVREPIPFQPTRVVALRPDAKMVHGTTDRLALVISQSGLDTVGRITGSAPAVPISDSVRALAFARARGGHGVKAYVTPMSQLVRESDIPQTYPLWTSIEVDSWSRVWVTLPTPAQRRGRWEVFDSTGAPLGRVQFPNSPLPRGHWSNGRYVVIDEDSSGRPVIRVWRLVESNTR